MHSVLGVGVGEGRGGAWGRGWDAPLAGCAAGAIMAVPGGCTSWVEWGEVGGLLRLDWVGAFLVCFVYSSAKHAPMRVHVRAFVCMCACVPVYA